MYTGRKMLCPN